MVQGLKRVCIENVRPEIDGGRYPIKRVVGEEVNVEADIFTDGHKLVQAWLLYRHQDEEWKKIKMEHVGNDLWIGKFKVEKIGIYYYTIEATIDHIRTLIKDIQRKAGKNLRTSLLSLLKRIQKTETFQLDEKLKLQEAEKILSELVDKNEIISLPPSLIEFLENLSVFDEKFSTKYEKILEVWVDRRKALFSTWYEIFPRSTSKVPGVHGTFKDLENIIPEIAEMGFDVLYLPPIHPIGKTNRKGKNNSPISSKDDPGSPWAIGSEEGGHKAISPQLGTFEDFERLLKVLNKYGIEIALDLAFQCSPDHPYVKEHPEWFDWLPDGSLHYAENPPKIYEDVVPFNFDTEEWPSLWEELKSIVLFWIKRGVKIFRVDNPHTKPFIFWEWLIKEIKKEYPEVIFLSEAFTRPKVMYHLAKIGFTQSYTYFTWRNTKWELINYIKELEGVKEYFRPNFWPNTPDILSEYLQLGGRPAFMIRLVLAATLSSNYGIYGPAYELCVTEALPGREEYLNSEKYEIKYWDRNKEGNIKDFVSRINKIRRENPALQITFNISFLEIDNDYLIAYMKFNSDKSNLLIIVVNLDPFHKQGGHLKLPLDQIGIPKDQPYMMYDLLGDEKFIWVGDTHYIELDPQVLPARIFRVHSRMRREQDFEYYM